MSLSSIDLFGKGICRPHNNLERRGLREDVLRRRIPVFFEFIGYKSDAHSEAVHKAQGPHHAGDERVAIVGFHGEILRPGLAVEVAGVRPAREGRGVVPHRGTPEGLIPGARKTMEAANGINYAACSLQLFMMGLNYYQD